MFELSISLQFQVAWGVEHHGLNCDSRSKSHHHSPLRRLPSLLGRCCPAAAQLIEHEDHRGATHVAKLAEHMATRRQFPVLQTEHFLDVVQDGTAAGMDRPEKVVPCDADAERAERVNKAAFDVGPQHAGHPAGEVVLHAAFAVLHGDGVLGLRYRGLRREHHLEQRALGRGADGVGADDDGAGAVTEQGLADDVVDAASLGPVEGDERELRAGDEDARAAVVLGELLGELERPPPAVAAVEAEDGAGHRGAEAQQGGQAAVAARGTRAGVGAEDEVGDVGGRAAPLRDGLGGGFRGQLRDGGGGHLHALVQGRPLGVDEARVGGQQLLVEVQVALPDAGLVVVADPAELGLEVREVLAVGDAEVVVGVIVLGHDARRVRRADGEHGGRPIRALRTPHLLDGGRRRCAPHVVDWWWLIKGQIESS